MMEKYGDAAICSCGFRPETDSLEKAAQCCAACRKKLRRQQREEGEKKAEARCHDELKVLQVKHGKEAIRDILYPPK